MQISVSTKFSLLTMFLQEKIRILTHQGDRRLPNLISTVFRMKLLAAAGSERVEDKARGGIDNVTKSFPPVANQILSLQTPGYFQSLETPGNTWKHLETPGNTWKHPETPGNTWKHLETPGCFQWQRQHLQPPPELF